MLPSQNASQALSTTPNITVAPAATRLALLPMPAMTDNNSAVADNITFPLHVNPSRTPPQTWCPSKYLWVLTTSVADPGHTGQTSTDT